MMYVRKTGEKIEGGTEKKIDKPIVKWTVVKIAEKIARWIGAKIAERIAGQTRAANFVGSIELTMLPASMVAKGETMLVLCKMVDRIEESG